MKQLNWWLILLGVICDQGTKKMAVALLDPLQYYPVLSPFLSFVLVKNYGAAYGILQNQRLFLVAVSVIVVGVCVIYRASLIQSLWSRWGITFLLMGTIGNLIDRVFLGYVIDFIDIGLFPVFNFADVFLDIGLVCFFIEFISEFLKKKPHA